MFGIRNVVLASRTACVAHPSSLRYASTRASQRLSSRFGRGSLTVAACAIAVSATAYASLNSNDSELHAEAKVSPTHIAEIVPLVAPQPSSKWDEAGVYAWGENRGRVVAPDSDEKLVKQPARLRCFDGMVLRDIKLNKDAGVAVLGNGDIVQWGIRYAPDVRVPELSLRGKDIKQVELSEDTLICLSNDGNVYTLPIGRQDQALGLKPTESFLFGFSKSVSPVSYRKLAPPLKSGERITGISSGKSHLLLVSSNGRVFSVASSAAFPEHGQMGIQGLTWKTRPPGPYDQCYEVPVATKIRKVAAGYYHSLLLDERGQVYAFGDNSSGQCGFDWAPDTEVIWRPTPIRIMPQESLSLDKAPVCRDISSGGNNSFFVVDAFKPNERIPTYEAVFACGRGLGGSLGNGKWSHYQGSPSKVKDLSGLFEYDERLQRRVPIRVSYITSGDAHSAAVLENGAGGKASLRGSNGSEYGSDVLIWGHNEYHQLGTGKRNNVNIPMHMQPLEWDRKAPVTPKDTIIDTIRFQVLPNAKVKVSSGKFVEVEQKIYCGESVTAAYCKARK